MEKNTLPFDFYEKLYDTYVTNYLPVIRTYEVSKGILTDLMVKVTYATYYHSPAEDFVRAIAYYMKDCHNYLGSPKPTVTISLFKGDEFMCGTFAEDDNYY